MISNIALRNFRSYGDFSRGFEEGINMVKGPNGSGKTNLLEAVYFVATGSSFRASQDASLVKHSEPWARVDADLDGSRFSRRIELQADSAAGSKKSLFVNGAPPTRGFTKKVPVVVFEPNQLRVFYEGPSHRRALMDDLADLISPSYRQVMSRYKRALAQRSAVLKRKLVARDFAYDDELFVWDMKLCQAAAKIYSSRAQAVGALEDKASGIYSGFAGQKSSLDFTYQSKVKASDYQSSMLRMLHDNIDMDVTRQRTSVGVHRDDLVCVLNGSNLVVDASRGEKRTALLSIKLIAASSDMGGSPKLLLLDDLFSELDDQRQKQLVKLLPQLTPKTIATTV